jgi:DNA helicase-2/ATP-dependent DNA helicase PcrA
MTEVIFGPPGTGKTAALMDIVDEELGRGTRSDRIALVSFTKRAAEEAIERARAKFLLRKEDLPWFRTLHSLCYRWLGVRSRDVLEGDALREFAVWAGVELSGKFSEDYEGYTQHDRIMHMIHLARVTCRPLRELYDEDDDQLPWAEVDRVERHLRAYKAATGKVDYTDMLVGFVREGGRVNLDVLLVDEAQDLSLVQWHVVERLAAGVRRVVYAGDDDQCIYGWAGAAGGVLQSLEAPSRVLDQSWRVPRQVQAVATQVISRVTDRRPKVWAARDEEGEVVRVDDLSQADIEEGEVLILARNSFVITERVIPELRRQGIYYAWGDRPAVREYVLRAIRTWEALRAGRRVTAEEAEHVLNYTSRRAPRKVGAPSPLAGAEEVSIEDLRARAGLVTDAIWHEALDRLPRDDSDYILAARRRGERVVGPPRVRVSTIHGAKGGEADHVVLLTEVAARTAYEAEQSPDDEARVWYVGVTRARGRLTIVGTGGKFAYDL